MTDQQLYDFFLENQLKQPEPMEREDTAELLLRDLEQGSCKGVGPIIAKRIRAFWTGDKS